MAVLSALCQCMHRASDVQKSANSQFFTMRLILGQCAYCRRSAMRLLSLFGYREFKDRLNPQTPTHQTVISFRSEPALKTSNCGQPASISLLLIQDFAGHAKILKSLSSTLYIFGSGPSPEDALVGYELERLVEGQHDTAHVIDVLPSSPV